MTEAIENESPLQGELQHPDQIQKVFTNIDQVADYVKSFLQESEVQFAVQSDPLYRFVVTHLTTNREG